MAAEEPETGTADETTTVVDVLGVLARMLDWDDRVTVGAVVVPIVEVPASRWLCALCRRRSYRLLDIADEGTRKRLRTEAMAGRISEQERIAAFQDLLERATGRSWWVAENLAIAVIVTWHAVVGPELTRAGWDVEDMTISQLLDFGYAALAKSVEPKEWDRIRMSLESIPPDSDDDATGDPDDLVMDEAAFQRTASRL